MNSISIVNAAYVEPCEGQSVMISQCFVGHFCTHNLAEETITLSGGYYREGTRSRCNYCIIKEITTELYPRVIREDWFRWMNGRYFHVHKPDVREIMSGSNGRCMERKFIQTETMDE